LDEYLVIVCHGYFLSCAVAALDATTQALEEAPTRSAELLPLLQQIRRTLQAVEEAFRTRIHAVRVARSEDVSVEDRIFQDIARQHFFRPSDYDLGSTEYADLQRLYRDKKLEKTLEQAAKAAAGKSVVPRAPPQPVLPKPSAAPKGAGRDKGKSAA
jgi:hypothetical protein